MKSNVEIIKNFLASQIDGEPVPPHGSKAIADLRVAIAEIHKHRSSQELQTLALEILGLIIDRAASGIQAEQTLQRFVRGDADY